MTDRPVKWSNFGLPTESQKTQLALLKTPLGLPGSGYTRYAAAMWLFQNGFLSGDALESYRICCKLDDEDPTSV